MNSRDGSDSLSFNIGLYGAPSAAPGTIEKIDCGFSSSDDTADSGLYPRGAKAILKVSVGGRVSEITIAPLPALLRGSWDLRGTHTVYGHTFCEGTGNLFNVRNRTEPSYVGQTKHGWYRRWRQHVGAAAAGSPYRFAQAIRRYKDSWAVIHEIISVGIDQAEAYDIEEYLVESYALYPHGFNMIPGGDAGIRYLSKLGAAVGAKDWERRDQVIERLIGQFERDHRPNPLTAALWRDDDYAASVICANPNNFSKQAIDEIRYLSSLGKTAAEIASKFQCRERRIAELLSGTTYSRVH